MQPRRRVPLRRLHARGVVRSADLRLPRGLRGRARLPAGALSAAFLFGACGPATVVSLDGDLDTSGAACDIDASIDRDSAFVAGVDTDLGDPICPVSDIDYWRLTTTAANQILDVTLSLVTAV